MTRKQKAFVAAVREGLGLEDAAARAGYGVEYAERLLEEPAIRAAIDAPDQLEPEPEQTPAEMLRRIALDPTQDERVKITAARALYMHERDVKPQPAAPVIIDDIHVCKDCPVIDGLTEIFKGIPDAREKLTRWAERGKNRFL